jgi:MFS family permease
MAADRYGRRPVLALALAGMTMATAWAQMICMRSILCCRSTTNHISVLASCFPSKVDVAVGDIPARRRRKPSRKCDGICHGS